MFDIQFKLQVDFGERTTLGFVQVGRTEVIQHFIAIVLRFGLDKLC